MDARGLSPLMNGFTMRMNPSKNRNERLKDRMEWASAAEKGEEISTRARTRWPAKMIS